MEDADRRTAPAALRRAAVPAVPFAFSLLLCLTTVGSTAFWQDSGFYLAAIHEMAVPASHGFVLYLFLAKAWSLLWTPLVGFTLAVHLFSSFCAAGAAAFLALAARAFLRRCFPSLPSDAPAIAAACVAAAGYCWWNSGILAKAYALYTLTMAVLLWILIVAEKPRQFLALGAVLGLCWAAHPSAAMLVPALLVYAWARREKTRELGAKGFAAMVLVAAAVAFVPSFVLLPVLSARESLVSLGDPRTPAEVWSHLRGAQYTDFKGAWGFEANRVLLAGRFIWEEFLGVGLLVLALGLWRLGKERPGVLGLLFCWSGPMLLLPLVFIGEGMFDQWFVIAYLPLALCVAVGFAEVASRAKVVFPALAASGLAWMILANYRDLNGRGYEMAETYGRLFLEPLEPGAVVVASTDDSAVLSMYLQRVRGLRPDIKLVHGEFVGLAWYDRRLEKQFGLHPAVPLPSAVPALAWNTAVANANAASGLPVYSERPADTRFLRPDLVQVPAGILWKIAVRGEEAVDPRFWRFPTDAASAAARRRRTRGILMRRTAKGMRAVYEPYEDRLVQALLQAKLRTVDPALSTEPARALAIYEEARALDSSLDWDATFQYNLGLSLYLLDRRDAALPAFERVLQLEPLPWRETLAHFYLGELLRAKRPEEAAAHYRRALEINGADPQTMITIRNRARQP